MNFNQRPISALPIELHVCPFFLSFFLYLYEKYIHKLYIVTISPLDAQDDSPYHERGGSYDKVNRIIKSNIQIYIKFIQMLHNLLQCVFHDFPATPM